MNIKAYLLIGGKRLESNIKELKKGIQILVGSPGRVLDLLNKKVFYLNYLLSFFNDYIREN